MDFEPNYTFKFPFETEECSDRLDDFIKPRQWFGFAVGAAYVGAVFGSQLAMRNRKKFQLKWFSIFWNVFLATLNLMAALRCCPHLIWTLQRRGFYDSVCVSRMFGSDTVSGFWARLYPIIKIIELGDTVLLAMQKRYIAHFYWCHHLGALLFAWYIYPNYPTLIFWLSVINDFFHVPVYAYGTVRSAGFNPPKVFPVILLLSEISQMLIGITFTALAYWYLAMERPCNISIFDDGLLLFIYTSLLVFCSVLFYQRFLKHNDSYKVEGNKGSVDAA